jgi:hypothetical protein
MLAQIQAKLVNTPVSERQRRIYEVYKDFVKDYYGDFLFSDDGAFVYANFDGKLMFLSQMYDFSDLN